MRYFPYAKGIKFKTIKNIIVSKLPAETWVQAVAQKKIVLVNNGSLLDNIISLIYPEAIKSIFPSAQIEVITPYPFLYKQQGLSKISNYSLNDEVLQKYTTPIFTTKDTIFFNTRYNYNYILDCLGNFVKRNKQPTYQKIIKNLLIEFNDNYFPKFRYNFNIKNKIDNYILIIPDLLPSEFGVNIYRNDFVNFNWSNNQLKSFVAMMESKGVKSVIISEKNYHGFNATFVKPTVESLLYYMIGCNMVLSKDYDPLLMVPILNKNAKIIYKIRLFMRKNFYYLNIKNKAIELDRMEPLDVFEEIYRDYG